MNELIKMNNYRNKGTSLTKVKIHTSSLCDTKLLQIARIYLDKYKEEEEEESKADVLQVTKSNA